MTTDAPAFSRYEKFVIASLSLLQFTVMLDFMVLSPLGAILIPQMAITTAQFGLVVSAYAFSAGISGLAAAGFADRFDRKRLLLVFYTGFIAGTVFCGLADSYETLITARIVTGIFGGVIGAISMAIITDIFPLEVRGRVMGFVQMSFAVSQVLGVPVGLFLATRLNWHAPFLMIALLALTVALLLAFRLNPVTGHLKNCADTGPFHHLLATAAHPGYIFGFLSTMLLATGGFMIMPFSSTFLVNNVLVPEKELSIIFFVTGLSSMLCAPFLGKLSDRLGKFRVFAFGSLLTIIMVTVYTHLGPNPVWLVVLTSIVLWIGISSRMISSAALTSAIPDNTDRGAYMGINSAIQQISGGAASFLAGLIVHQPFKDAPLQGYGTVGYITACTMLFTLIMMHFVNLQVSRKQQSVRNSL